ncbi:hypothetical protein [Klenkia terrae]|uniref:hypothetical protein n=1 Tax=Klenkia terrae TaxID=1052259 RepID=UPI001CD88D94|nr:hypothetical protein [Klenkia terrae]
MSGRSAIAPAARVKSSQIHCIRSFAPATTTARSASSVARAAAISDQDSSEPTAAAPRSANLVDASDRQPSPSPASDRRRERASASSRPPRSCQATAASRIPVGSSSMTAG